METAAQPSTHFSVFHFSVSVLAAPMGIWLADGQWSHRLPSRQLELKSDRRNQTTKPGQGEGNRDANSCGHEPGQQMSKGHCSHKCHRIKTHHPATAPVLHNPLEQCGA